MKVLLALATAAVATVAAVVLGLAPASATYDEPTQSADVETCGQVTLSGTPGEYGKYELKWHVVDTDRSGAFDLPGSEVVTFDEDFGGGTATVEYHVNKKYSPHDLEVEQATVDTDCQPPPTEPTVPTTLPPTTSTTVPDIVDPAPVAPSPALPVAAPPAVPQVAQPQFTG